MPPSIRNLNQAAPFWDFIANLQEQASNYPLFPAAARDTDNDEGDAEMPWHSYGWGGRGHRGRHGPGRGGRGFERGNFPFSYEDWFGTPEHQNGRHEHSHWSSPQEPEHHREDDSDVEGTAPFDLPMRDGDAPRHDGTPEAGPPRSPHAAHPHPPHPHHPHGPPHGAHPHPPHPHHPHGPPHRAHPHPPHPRPPHEPHSGHSHEGPPFRGGRGRHHGRGHSGRHRQRSEGPRNVREGSDGMGGPYGLADIAQFFQSQLFGNNNAEKKRSGNDDFTPPVDVFDTEAAYVVHVSLAGAKKEDITLNWDADQSELKIGGVIVRPGDEEFLKTLALDERNIGVFERKVKLGSRAHPARVQGEGISAKLEAGVLTIQVPKETMEDFVNVMTVDID